MTEEDMANPFSGDSDITEDSPAFWLLPEPRALATTNLPSVSRRPGQLFTQDTNDNYLPRIQPRRLLGCNCHERAPHPSPPPLLRSANSAFSPFPLPPIHDAVFRGPHPPILLPPTANNLTLSSPFGPASLPILPPAPGAAPPNTSLSRQRNPQHDSWPSPHRVSPGRGPTSDDYLLALANGDFSSPSIPANTSPAPHLPLSNSSLSSPPIDASAALSGGLFSRPAVTFRTTVKTEGSEAARQPAARQPAADEGGPSQQQEEGNMPTSRRTRNPVAEAASSVSPVTRPIRGVKRRRTSSTPSRPARRFTPSAAVVVGDSADEFADSEEDDRKTTLKSEEKKPELEIIDLAGVDEVPENLKHVPASTKTPLNEFQCVICMDDVKHLTVTHCGHLFCAECLHSSLHIDATKKVCPICRQKVDAKPASGKYGPKAKGFYPLELRLMTKKRSGKRVATS